MSFFHGNIDVLTAENTDYRRVLYTDREFQLVVMCLKPLEEIGREVHPETTQFIKIAKGFGLGEVDGTLLPLKTGSSVVVPPGAYHNFKNMSPVKDLKLYTIYTPPEHPPGLIQTHKS